MEIVRSGADLKSLNDLEEGQCVPPHCRKYDAFREDCQCKYDGRLFPEYKLYCEGMNKPKGRGKIHLAASLLLPLGLVHLFLEANGSFYGIISSTFYIFTNIWCYGVSGIYHVFQWSARTEIILQKLDHCGIALLSCGTMMPVIFLLAPWPYGFFHGFISVVSCSWCCYHIMVNHTPSVFRQAVVAASLLPFIPLYYYFMNTLEFSCMLMTIVFQVCGMVVFVQEFKGIDPDCCGYHEIFHVLVVMAGVCVYICNWSIIRRTCNPYYPTDVWEDLVSMSHLHS